jgi:hypothetical protein
MTTPAIEENNEQTTYPENAYPETMAPADAAPEGADYWVVPAVILNDIAAYLMERPWREVQGILRGLDGIRSLDEYLPVR